MPYRRDILANGEFYHIFTKSIAGFKIFNKENDFRRMVEALFFYSLSEPPYKFSLFVEQQSKNKEKDLLQFKFQDKIIKIIAYCIMPTHIHFVLQQLQDDGISRYMNLLLKSYSKFFNVKYKRRGPLWEGRFKNVLINSDEQLLHLTRYIHLNPTSASIVDNPQDWQFSSYKEYIGLIDESKRLCDFSDLLDIDKAHYKTFVEDRIDYQRELEKIKHLILE